MTFTPIPVGYLMPYVNSKCLIQQAQLHLGYSQANINITKDLTY